jgi:hypothetical protein
MGLSKNKVWHMKNKIALTVILAALGGWLSRWHGGGWNIKAVKVVKNLAWALPACGVIYLINPWLAPLGLLNMLKAMGHGRGLGLDEPMREDMEPEKIEAVIRWLEPSLTVHAYKHVIMALTGLLAVSGSVAAFLFINPIGALIIALAGLLKGVAYEIGLIISPAQTKTLGFYKTEWGEIITGIFGFGGIGIAYFLQIL